MSDYTLKIKKDTFMKYTIFFLLAVIIVGGIVMFDSRTGTTGQITDSGERNVGEIDIGDSPVLGDPDAPVTIVEFMDYHCSFCGRHHQQTFPLLKNNYIDQGLVKYVVMDFVAVGNPKTHEAARCVRELGSDEQFWEYHGSLFDNQQRLSAGNSVLRELAVAVGIDGDEFISCLDSGRHSGDVNADSAYGRSLGVSGTPGFFVNGVEIRGAQPYSVFEQAIEQQL